MQRSADKVYYTTPQADGRRAHRGLFPVLLPVESNPGSRPLRLYAYAYATDAGVYCSNCPVGRRGISVRLCLLRLGVGVGDGPGVVVL